VVVVGAERSLATIELHSYELGVEMKTLPVNSTPSKQASKQATRKQQAWQCFVW
jgi:hypothetical protein